MLTYSHILVTSAFSQEKISSVGIQPSADVSTLNHNVLRLVGRQWWVGSGRQSLPVFSWLPVLLLPSAPEPTWGSHCCLPQPANCCFSALEILHSQFQWGKNQACHPLLLHCWTRSWYLVVFLSRASSHLSSHGTVGSTMIIFPSPLGPNDYVWPHGCLDSGGNVVSFPGSASSSRIEWSAGGFWWF